MTKIKFALGRPTVKESAVFIFKLVYTSLPVILKVVDSLFEHIPKDSSKIAEGGRKKLPQLIKMIG